MCRAWNYWLGQQKEGLRRPKRVYVQHWCKGDPICPNKNACNVELVEVFMMDILQRVIVE